MSYSMASLLQAFSQSAVVLVSPLALECAPIYKALTENKGVTCTGSEPAGTGVFMLPMGFSLLSA
jgi:hypothetical protein